MCEWQKHAFSVASRIAFVSAKQLSSRLVEVYYSSVAAASRLRSSKAVLKCPISLKPKTLIPKSSRLCHFLHPPAVKKALASIPNPERRTIRMLEMPRLVSGAGSSISPDRVILIAFDPNAPRSKAFRILCGDKTSAAPKKTAGARIPSLAVVGALTIIIRLTSVSTVHTQYAASPGTQRRSSTHVSQRSAL